MELCPPELYRALCEVRGEVPKRLALVEERGEPLAIVGLRWDEPAWIPVTNWVLPGTQFPVRDGRLLDVLNALRLKVFVAWWRQLQGPPSDVAGQAECTPTHKLACDGTHEAYWDKCGFLKQILAVRRRCRHLQVAVNAEGVAALTLNNWGRRYARAGLNEVVDTCERRCVAEYWLPRGRQVAVSLMDGETVAASALVFVHHEEVVGQAFFREPGYDRLSVGTRLLDAITTWAVEQGMRKHDFGGGHAYKDSWAPEDGQRWQFTIEPAESRLKRVAERIRALGK